MQTDNSKRLSVADIVKFVVFVAIGFFFVYWFVTNQNHKEFLQSYKLYEQ